MHIVCKTILTIAALCASGAAAPLAAAGPSGSGGISAAPIIVAQAASSNSRKKTAANRSSRKATADNNSSRSIIVLVNDEPITNFDVERRAALLALQTNIGKDAQARFKAIVRSPSTQKRMREFQQQIVANNPGKTREQLIAMIKAKSKSYAMSLQQQAVSSARQSVLPKVRRKALDDLIDERLQIQSAKKKNIVVAPKDVDEAIKAMAGRNKMTVDQFAAHLRKLGTDISTMRSRTQASMAWRQMVGRHFGRFVSISDAQVDNAIAAMPGEAGEETLELRLQRITLPLANNNDQKLIAQRYNDAENLRRRFRDCKTMPALAKLAPKAKYEALGMRKASSIDEPTRTLLVNATDGQLAPPSLTPTGIELYAVCGRRTVMGDDATRAKTQSALRQKEFELLARRHMRDLRIDSHICRRANVPHLMHLTSCG